MSAQTISNQRVIPHADGGIISRGFALVYALLCYAIGAGALFWLFFAAADIAPYSLSGYRATGAAGALLINAGLIFLFALQHTVMARRSFKQKWTRLVPEHLERSTFVLASGIIMAALLWTSGA